MPQNPFGLLTFEGQKLWSFRKKVHILPPTLLPKVQPPLLSYMIQTLH